MIIALTVFVSLIALKAPLADNSYIDQVLHKTSQSIHQCILLEGDPYRETVNIENSGAKSEDISFLKRVAAESGYDLTRSNKLCLLQKNYVNTADLPSVTIDECILGIRDAFSAINSLAPVLTTTEQEDVTYSLYHPIYSLQGTAIGKRLEEGISIRQLPTEISAAVYQIYAYKKTTQNIKSSVYPYLEKIYRSIKDIDYLFRYQSYPSATLFGYQIESRADKKQSIFHNIEQSPRLNYQINAKGEIVDIKIRERYPDVVSPRKEEKEIVQRPLKSKTLREVAEENNKTAPEGTRFAVEEVLAEKRVRIYGAEFTDAATVFRGIAELYGLRLTHNTEGTYRLERRRAAPPQSLQDLPDAIRTALPAPLLRLALRHSNDWCTENKIPLVTVPTWAYASRRLRAVVDPKLKTSKEGFVRLDDLDEPTRQYFAMCIAFQSLDETDGSLLRALASLLTDPYLQATDIRIRASWDTDSRNDRWCKLLFTGTDRKGEPIKGAFGTTVRVK